MYECNSIIFRTIRNRRAKESLEEQMDYVLQCMGKISLYLKDGITDFQHKCKLVDSIRSNRALHVARLNGDITLRDLQS